MGSTNYYNMFCVMGSPFLTCVHAQVKSLGLGQAKPSPALIEGCRLGLGFQQAPSPQKLSPAWGLKPKPGLHITRYASDSHLDQKISYSILYQLFTAILLLYHTHKELLCLNLQYGSGQHHTCVETDHSSDMDQLPDLYCT